MISIIQNCTQSLSDLHIYISHHMLVLQIYITCNTCMMIQPF